MAYSTKLSVAIHILLAIVRFGDEERQTSTALADSIQVNPVIVRNLLQKLKKADLVSVEAGVGGAHLTKDPADFTLFDIFNAVEGEGATLFKRHENPNPDCELGSIVKQVITPSFDAVEASFVAGLKAIPFQKVVDDMYREMAAKKG